MVIVIEDDLFASKWLLRRFGRFIQDIQIDLEDNEIVLGKGNNEGIKNSVGVSRRHALLKRITNDQWKIKDLGSVNGLFINATKVAENCCECLKEFDIIGLGVANAIHEEHFSLMLCRKPELHLHDRELFKSPGNTILIDSTDRNNNVVEQNLNPKGKNRNMAIEDCNKEESSIGFVNTGTLQKLEEINSDDVCVLFQTTNYKRKRKEVIVLSDDTDSEDEIVRVPRKRSKLNNRKPIVLSSEESDCTCDETIVNNIKTCEGFSNFCNETKEVDVKFNEKYHDPNEEKVEGKQYLYCSYKCDQKSKQNSIDDTGPNSKAGILEEDCVVKRDFVPSVDSTTVSKENACLAEQSQHCINLSFNFDISVAIHEEEKFYSQGSNALIISEEDFEEYKQNELANIKKECIDAYINKEQTVLRNEKQTDETISQKMIISMMLGLRMINVAMMKCLYVTLWMIPSIIAIIRIIALMRKNCWAA